MTQPINSGAPLPVQGVTGGPGLPQGAAGIDGTTGNIVLTPPSNTIQQKKTDSPQAFQVYEFFHSDSDFVRISLATQTNGPEFIGVEVFPAGVLRDLIIGTSGNLLLNAGASSRWTISGTTGALIPFVDNTEDIGTTPNRVRSIFVGSSIGINIAPTALTGITVSVAAMPAFTAGCVYVVWDTASGQFKRSAIGPAS